MPLLFFHKKAPKANAFGAFGGDGGKSNPHACSSQTKRFRVVDGGVSAGPFRVTEVPPGKPANPLLMRVCEAKRASTGLSRSESFRTGTAGFVTKLSSFTGAQNEYPLSRTS